MGSPVWHSVMIWEWYRVNAQEGGIYIHTPTHTYIYMYLFMHTHTHTYTHLWLAQVVWQKQHNIVKQLSNLKCKIDDQCKFDS